MAARRRDRAVALFVSALATAACGTDDPEAGADAPLDTGGDAPQIRADADPLDDADGVDSADLDREADGSEDGPVVDPRFAPILAAANTDLERAEATAASIAVWLDGEIVWVGGVGEMPERDGDAPGERTLFMIGSDTKKITAIAALQAIARGQATLETRVRDVFPDLALGDSAPFLEATLGALLSHQGGISDHVDVGTRAADSDLLDYLYARLGPATYSMAPPGVLWNYSNPNFSVAGAMTEALVGTPWADLVARDVFAPLGMDRTVARKASVDADHCLGVGLTSPEDNEPGIVSLDDTWETAFVRPAGLVWSTPSDQMRLAAFLVDGDEAVLPNALLDALHGAQAPIYPDLPGDYGFGLMVGRGISLADGFHDIPVWSHGGNTWTHTSTFFVLPEQRFAISILSNGLGDDFSTTAATAMSTLAELPPPSEPPTPPFDASALDSLVGTYADPFNVGTLAIARDGDVLTLDAPSLDALDIPYTREMSPLSTRVWLVEADGTTLDFAFIQGPDGETYFRNRAVVAVRDAAGKRAAPPGMRAPDRARARAALRHGTYRQPSLARAQP